MNSTEILKTITGVLDTLSKKLGVAVDKIYPVLLRQVKVNLVQDIFSIIIAMIIIFVTIKVVIFVHKKYKKEDSYDSDYDLYNFLACLFGTIITIICFVVICFKCNQLIQIILNPNYFIFNHYIQPLIQK